VSTYLDNYGAGEAERERLWKRLALVVLAGLAVGVSLYWFVFRNRAEKQQAERFFELLAAKDYKAAHALWGCTDEKPCRDYGLDKFLEDWGPNSTHADVSKRQIKDLRSCQGGIIQVLEFGKSDQVLLWVNRADLTLSFAPWPTCNPGRAFRQSNVR
jgi:hypothetical protein